MQYVKSVSKSFQSSSDPFIQTFIIVMYLKWTLWSWLMTWSEGHRHLDQPHGVEIMTVLSFPVKTVIYQTCYTLEYSTTKRHLKDIRRCIYAFDKQYPKWITVQSSYIFCYILVCVSGYHTHYIFPAYAMIYCTKQEHGWQMIKCINIISLIANIGRYKISSLMWHEEIYFLFTMASALPVSSGSRCLFTL